MVKKPLLTRMILWWHRRERICENCIYWLRGYKNESEKIGKCVQFFYSGAAKYMLHQKCSTGEDRLAFVDSPREEPVYTTCHYGCNRHIPNTQRGRFLLIRYDREHQPLE